MSTAQPVDIQQAHARTDETRILRWMRSRLCGSHTTRGNLNKPQISYGSSSGSLSSFHSVPPSSEEYFQNEEFLLAPVAAAVAKEAKINYQICRTTCYFKVHVHTYTRALAGTHTETQIILYISAERDVDELRRTEINSNSCAK